MKYWENIADQLSRDGWACWCVSYFDAENRRMFFLEAQREGCGRFIVHADDILTAFHELEMQCRAAVLR